MVATFVTTYKRCTLTCSKRKEEKERENIKELIDERRKKTTSIDLIVNECKSIRISSQKHCEMLQCVSSRVLIPVKSLTLV